MSKLSRERTAVDRTSRDVRWRRFAGAIGVTLMLVGLTAGAAGGVSALPVLWTAGGLDSGTTGAGQAGRLTSDAASNVAVVSGPTEGRDLAVTSYTPNGTLRWRRTISPVSGTFQGDWILAAPNRDLVAVGHSVTSRGNPIAISLVRYAFDGTLLWRVNPAGTIPRVARLLIDAGGNAYLAFSSVGDGQDIQVQKYSPTGALVWSRVVSTGFFANDIATSMALSPDETDVVVTGNVAGGAEWITATYNATTGDRRWLVTAPEGIAARDVVVDATRVYVTGEGNVGIAGFLTVVAYDRATGARLWRTDKKAGRRRQRRRSPDGPRAKRERGRHGPGLTWIPRLVHSLLRNVWGSSVGGSSRRWVEYRRDSARRAGVGNGTTVVTGRGGPNLPGGFIPGVTAGYDANGILRWEAFSRMETVWATGLTTGDVCAAGGYDALITCWRVPRLLAGMPPRSRAGRAEQEPRQPPRRRSLVGAFS